MGSNSLTEIEARLSGQSSSRRQSRRHEAHARGRDECRKRPSTRATELVIRCALCALCVVVPALACGAQEPRAMDPSSETTGPEALVQPIGSETRELAELIELLSEEGAYFDTDNLISNERSFVRVVDLLEPSGGVYLGVGPEQNFNLIARTRPRWAFIVDIRRDNLVQHLLLNAVLAASPTPEAYLRTLLSLPPPDVSSSAQDPLDEVIARIDAASEGATRAALERNVEQLEAHVRGLGIELTADDLEHFREIAEQFFSHQLDLRFRSHGRGLSSRYPTYRELISARTPGSAGEWGSFLGSSESYDFVRELARSGRLVPVVGDFAGDQALHRVGELVRALGLEVTTFYTSNVEFYLLRNGVFSQYLRNLESLPWAEDGILVRACFDYGGNHPLRVPGHRSATVLQRYRDLARLARSDAIADSWDLCTRGGIQ